MQHFWKGFTRKRASVSSKKHAIVLFWDPSKPTSVVSTVKKLSFRYPSVRVKIVNASKDPARPARLKVQEFPTVLLLKNGREVSRATTKSESLIEQLFRKAHV